MQSQSNCEARYCLLLFRQAIGRRCRQREQGRHRSGQEQQKLLPLLRIENFMVAPPIARPATNVRL